MYYLIFHYKEGRQELAVKGAGYESDIINFIHDNYKEIDVHRILEVSAEYRLGLVVTEDYVKSELEPKEETESLVPTDKDLDAAILKEKKRKLKEIETEEPSAMSKIADDIEKEMSDEEKDKATMDKANRLIDEGKEREKEAKGWPLCTECNVRHVAPWNKKGICSPCQKPPATRKYSMANR